MAAGDQVPERDQADQPPLHLAGAGLDGQVDVVAGIVLAHGDRAAINVEPAFGGARSVERTCTWRFTSAEEFVAFFRRWYGPTLKAFEAAGDDGRDALAADLADLARRRDRNGDGGSIAIPASYLETVLTLR